VSLYGRKQSLKGKSEAVNRRTDNTKPTRKRKKPQSFTKHYTEIQRLSNKTPTKNRGSNRRCSVWVYIFCNHHTTRQCHYFNYITIVNQLLLVTFFCANYHNSRPLYDEMMCIEKRTLS